MLTPGSCQPFQNKTRTGLDLLGRLSRGLFPVDPGVLGAHCGILKAVHPLCRVVLILPACRRRSAPPPAPSLQACAGASCFQAADMGTAVAPFPGQVVGPPRASPPPRTRAARAESHRAPPRLPFACGRPTPAGIRRIPISAGLFPDPPAPSLPLCGFPPSPPPPPPPPPPSLRRTASAACHGGDRCRDLLERRRFCDFARRPGRKATGHGHTPSLRKSPFPCLKAKKIGDLSRQNV